MQVTITAGLAGAFLLGRGRPEGLALMENTPEGAWRSFVAAFVCLPAFLAVRFFAWASLGAPAGGLGRAMTAEVIGYTVAWVGFALVSLPLVTQWGQAARWPRFIAAWNWTNVVQYIVLLALAVPGALGAPGPVSDVLTLFGLGYAIWLEWFVAREALGVDRARAALLVVLDLMLGLFLGGLIHTLSKVAT
jgi:hypothetical protein